MMTVTKEAKSHLAAALDAAAPEQESSCFRIVRDEGNRMAMKIDPQGASDAVVEHDGKPLLAMDPEVESMLDGHTLDVQPNEQGQPVLTIK